MNQTPGRPALISKALKIGILPVKLKRTRTGWVAVVPSKITKGGGVEALSAVTLCDFGSQTKRATRLILASRYLAQVYEDSEIAFINLRWALKLPNWAGPYGAMNELSSAMKRAGLI